MEKTYSALIKKNSGWLPFWYGNKFNKRLVQKKIRREHQKEVDQLLQEEMGYDTMDILNEIHNKYGDNG